MNAGGRLALYAAGVAVAFGAAFGLSGAVVPDGFVTAGTENNKVNTHGEGHGDSSHGSMPGHGLNGTSLSADGFVLSPVTTPAGVGKAGELSFRVTGPDGAAATEYTTAHGKDLHLIVVRSDGTGFRHVHPTLDKTTGTWSIPWTWDQAGTYRVYADFTPAGANAAGITLSRTVEVAGPYHPAIPVLTKTAVVDGYTVTLAGDLKAAASSELTVTVTRDGKPVTTLQPYLGAFGHLVALREGDLAYLHVHPDGAEPDPGATGGPDVKFAAEAPTVGRYLLYLDFQIDGVVRTAPFVVDAH